MKRTEAMTEVCSSLQQRWRFYICGSTGDYPALLGRNLAKERERKSDAKGTHNLLANKRRHREGELIFKD